MARHGGLCALALGTLCLNACRRAGSGAPAGEIELTVSIGAWGGERKRVLTSVIREFEREHSGVVVRPLYIGGRYYDKVEVMIAGQCAPDVMWMGYGFGVFATRGAFLNLDDLYGDIDRSRYFSEVLDWYSVDEKLYGFPYGVDIGFIAYNKDLFDDAGVAYPEPDWTVEEFLAIARRLTLDTDGDGAVDQYGFAGGLARGTFGDTLLNEDNTLCTLDRPAAARMLQFSHDLVHKYRVSPPQESDIKSMGTEISFLMGRIAMWRTAVWKIPALRQKVDTFEWDIAMMPIGTQRAHMASSSGFAVARDTEHPREAIALLKALTGPRFARGLGGATLPVERDVAARMARAWQGPPEHFGLMLAMTDYMHPVPRVPNIGEIMQVYGRHADRFDLGRVSAAEAMRGAAREINAILAKQRRREP